MVAHRIKKHIDYKDISFYAFENSIEVSRGAITKTIKENRGIGSSVVEKILIVYFDLNPEWFLTGKGEMLCPVEAEKGADPQGAPQVEYGKPKSGSCSYCQEKEKVLQGLEVQLEEVRHRLADKDKKNEALELQIEDLKNNLERLISDKGEVIKMKDEMLVMKEEPVKGKEEIIGVLHKRIAELESCNETEEAKKILRPVERIDQKSPSLTNIQSTDVSTRAKQKEEYQP